ncbi:MAG: aspartate/glutamate racemase family protein [Gammaproteobacteria bacterium]|nr:aspartate/glutamate racemase family protein [Gammaproteobacteria bacterium]
MKIMWINPLGRPDDDEAIAALIKGIKSTETEVEVVSLDTSPSPIDLEYRTYEALFYTDIIHLVRYAANNHYDAAVLGCFYDPIIADAREISGEMIVIGPCQASIQIMANLCNRFSVIVGSQKEVNQMHDNIHQYGYGRQLASIRAMNLTTTDFLHNKQITEQAMLQHAGEAVKHDFAEGIILGCTLESGYHRKLQEQLDVPVVDCVYAAYKTAEHLAVLKNRFGWKPSRKWSCAPPPEKSIEEFGLFQDEPPIGNRITVN